MKHVNEIINHLFPHPSVHSKFQFHRCMGKMFSLLPVHLSKSVVYSYMQDEITLCIVVSNNAMTTEFHYKQNLIKELLKEITKVIPCDEVEKIKNIKVRYLYTPPAPLAPPQKITLPERSRGDFINYAMQNGVVAKIEHIRSLIQELHR